MPVCWASRRKCASGTHRESRFGPRRSARLGALNDEVTRTRQVTALSSAPRRAFLDIVSGAPAARFPVDRDPTLLGRSQDADVRLDVDGVSRRHARIVKSGPVALSIVDLGAKNGTFVNGQRTELAALHNGDRIQLGPVTLLVSIVSDSVSTQGSDAGPALSSEASVRAELSPREWEVAAEVAKGLTNADIATELGISKRTVATHLERIFGRLNIHSRAVLARMVAVERGSPQ